MAMTKDEFRDAVTRHGYTLMDFALDFGVSYETVRQWGGRASVPRWATRVLSLMDQHGRAHVGGVSEANRGIIPLTAGVSPGKEETDAAIMCVWPQLTSPPLRRS